MIGRRVKVVCWMVGSYLALLLPGLVFEGYASAVGLSLAIIPYFTVLLLSSAGLPGVLDHNGACGWGWCAPTVLGWAAAGAIWLGIAWLVAGIVVRSSGCRETSGAPAGDAAKDCEG